MTEGNIVLTGFMGTGKTTIGQELGRRTGRPFVDLDDVIAARAGKSVAAIFAEDGEPAFRALEAAVCREMGAPAARVIAAGGGAILDPANRESLAAGGTLICLDAGPATIAARLKGQDDRPLLRGNDRTARIESLLQERAVIYEALPNHLDTSDLAVAAAAERILGIVAGLPEGGYRLPVRLPGANLSGDSALAGGDGPLPSGRSGYDILIAEGLLAQAGQRLREAGLPPGRCAVISNPTVVERHWPALLGALSEAGFSPVLCQVPDGEAFKVLDTAAAVYTQLAAARLGRGEPVIALGGGVVGDLAGFVASTWLRGVPFVQVPTTLLAMIDSSVGGKVAVDLPEGKNLVGAFKQPALVLIDPLVLNTLPPPEYRSGLAEVIKTAIIGDAALFAQLYGQGPGSLVSMIADTVRVKALIVERDPYEYADRAWLNLGHTFGHALELVSGFTLRHGEAVALGTVAAAELSAGLGYCEEGLPALLKAAIGRLGLPICYAFDPQAALAAMGTDKKRRAGALRFVLPVRIGEVTVVEGVSQDAVLRALDCIREGS